MGGGPGVQPRGVGGRFEGGKLQPDAPHRPRGPEIGYWIHPSWTRLGLATAAAVALVREAFTLPGIELVEIHHDEANKASGGVPGRLGFTEVERRPAVEGPTAPGEEGVKVVWRIHRDGPALPAATATG